MLLEEEEEDDDEDEDDEEDDDDGEWAEVGEASMETAFLTLSEHLILSINLPFFFIIIDNVFNPFTRMERFPL